MKTKLNGILTLLLALVVQVAFAQQTVTGTVTDPDGLPVLGATVLVEGTQTFAQTNFDGVYTIQASAESSLVFSYPGYDSQTIPVAGKTTIDVQMSSTLEEVVVQAYRTSSTKRSNIAASVVTAKQIQDRPNASAIQRLQGQVPGLIIQTATGQPGANSLIQLRGVSSINGNTEPLIVIDGIPVDEDTFRTINPLDIESQSILKDAAATAIYGNRGANGVIVITTKGGKYDSPLTVSYTAQTRFTELIDTEYDLYNSRDYLRLEQSRGVGLGNTLSDAEINGFGIDTDWSDTFYQTGVSQLHNLSLRSGGKNLSQFTSINYTLEEGSLLRTDLQRFTIRNNLTLKSNDDKFNLSTSLQIGYSKNNSQTEPETRNNAIYFNSIYNSNFGLPYFDPNNRANLEDWVSSLQARFSPYVTLDNIELNNNTENEIKIVAGARSSYKITDNWTASYNIGMDYTQEVGLRTADPRSGLARVRASFIGPGEVEGFQTENYFHDFRFNSTASIGWNKTYGADENGDGGHTFLANAYLEYVKAHFKSFNYSQTGLDPRTFSPGNGAGFIGDNEANDEFVPTVGSSKASTGLFSYFGEFDYDYDNKYGFTGTIRRDASSRFTGDNTWGTFWSVAGRWNVSEEDFMKDVSWIDDLKIRASYGTVGNDRIQSGYYAALNNTRTLFATGLSYNDNQTFVRAQLGNDELRWESINTANLGIEFAMFDKRLRGTLEFYNRETTDLFSPRAVSTLVVANGSIDANIGDMVNRGIELGTRYDLIVDKSKDGKGFDLDLFANVSYNQNEVTSIDAPDGVIDNGATVIQEGAQLNEFFLLDYIGVNPANGNLLFSDANGNTTENPTLDDRKLTGTDTVPDFQGGFGFEINYQNFFFETQFSFMTGLQRLDFTLRDYYDINNLGQTQLSSDLSRSWTADNRVTDMPSLSATNLSPAATSDRFLIDSDFLRVRFMQFGYNFDSSMLDKTFLNSARIYMNAENLVTWTEWLGSDPESQRASEYNRYPTPRIISVGLDITF